MYCALSGETPLDPVVSRRTGHLYERRLIGKYLQEEGRCPVTGDAMSEEDLMSVAVNKLISRPPTTTAASVPGLLSLLQNEWDDIAIGTFNLKQILDSTRRDLSQALYQHDAASRVIARLMRERDEARAIVAVLRASGHEGVLSSSTSSNSSSSIHRHSEIVPRSSEAAQTELAGEREDPSQFRAAIDSQMASRMQVLSVARRGRKPAPSLATKEVLSKIKTTVVSSPHKASPAGILCIALQQSTTGSRILTGGMDKDALLLAKDGSCVAKLSGHSAKVTAVTFSNEASPLYTASADRTVKVWALSNSCNYSVALTFTPHRDEVTALSLLPIGTATLSFSLDGTWALLDSISGTVVRQVSVSGSRLLCGQCHPDGLLLGTGTDKGLLKVFDIREEKGVGELGGHDVGEVSSLCFSENGYSLATGDSKGTLRMWDLRKMSCINALELGPTTLSALCYDWSGQYLACCGGGENGGTVTIRTAKELIEVASLEAHLKPITGAIWGGDAKELWTCSLDKAVKLHSCL